MLVLRHILKNSEELFKVKRLKKKQINICREKKNFINYVNIRQNLRHKTIQEGQMKIVKASFLETHIHTRKQISSKVRTICLVEWLTKNSRSLSYYYNYLNEK